MIKFLCEYIRNVGIFCGRRNMFKCHNMKLVGGLHLHKFFRSCATSLAIVDTENAMFNISIFEELRLICVERLCAIEEQIVAIRLKKQETNCRHMR
jgi:hypothetical protein